MATNTPRHALRKPDGTDLVNVLTDLGENFDKIDKAPRGELGFGSLLANQSPITGIVAVNNCTLPAITVSAVQDLLIVVDGLVASTVAGDTARLMVEQDNVLLRDFYSTCAAAGVPVSIGGSFKTNASAGAHVYRLTVVRQFGTGNLTLYSTCQLMVSDIGAY